MRRQSKEQGQEECCAHEGKRNGEKQAIFKCQINRTGSLCFLVISIAEFAILKKNQIMKIIVQRHMKNCF